MGAIFFCRVAIFIAELCAVDALGRSLQLCQTTGNPVVARQHHSGASVAIRAKQSIVSRLVPAGAGTLRILILGILADPLFLARMHA